MLERDADRCQGHIGSGTVPAGTLFAVYTIWVSEKPEALVYRFSKT